MWRERMGRWRWCERGDFESLPKYKLSSLVFVSHSRVHKKLDAESTLLVCARGSLRKALGTPSLLDGLQLIKFPVVAAGVVSRWRLFDSCVEIELDSNLVHGRRLAVVFDGFPAFSLNRHASRGHMERLWRLSSLF